MGDIVLTTSNRTMIDNVIKGEYPVVYDPPKPKRIIPTERDLYTFDKFGMGSIIGQITNKGATMYAMLPNLKKKYGEQSKEYQMVLCRLKQTCKAQSAQIDRTKIGQEVKGIPKCWTTRMKPEDDELRDINEDDLYYYEYNNILLDKRPYFFKYLYKDSKQDYKAYQNKQEILCIKNFGKPLDTVLHSLNPSEEENEFIKQYYEWCPLVISDSCMNLLCNYIEKIDFNIKSSIKIRTNFEEYSLYKNPNVNYTLQQKKMALRALKDFNRLKAEERISKSNISNRDIEKFDEAEVKVNLLDIALNYINNVDILTNIYVDYFYKDIPKSNKDTLWKFFGKYMVNNILIKNNGKVTFPIKQEDGRINYLGELYEPKEIMINVDR